ncbi:carbamoyltransferase HypF [Chloroflexus aggregans]|uniref:Carbamoyltransferase n=1 Tax=Chloroflexus aggregans (strain MD-66 / DSM 9485) TaxID=326427 RepID=B8G3M4_CHLAD|nr:carbamoyltransferase HypF [Chloroflexus aggregans]ACL23407.1 (NiFe) hydrogenase maturation protein HypF [Chloroflexus aggregans DSM 9485]
MTEQTITNPQQRRWRIYVRGIVQGVGFRPFVFGLAERWQLAGFVRNDSYGVTIEIEGEERALHEFVTALQRESPPLARIEQVSIEPLALVGERAFVIAASQAQAQRRTLIAPDTATCADCLREITDPADRRYRYAFTNCTNCGPRFTIVLDVPYDRANTTMRSFVLCERCRAEYEDPRDRRFHAQPTACPVCGPQLQWLTADGVLAEPDPLRAAAVALAQGQIVAVKGLGGYHLACAADDEAAVRRLRQRKQREARPLALMTRDLTVAARLCVIDPVAQTLLTGPAHPIVLMPRRSDAPVAPSVAPGMRTLGVMLPYTPLHHLLLAEYAAVVGPTREAVIVLTSGNLSDEPIAYHDDDAQQRLGPIADAFLTHNRPIHMRCDDSVASVAVGGPLLIRRSRGYAPAPITLAAELPCPILACGGHLKNTFALGRGREVFLSHHIGDLENLPTLRSFHEGIAHFQRLFDITPEVVAYDLHPGYLATQAALAMPIERKIGVQHHHAHIAAVLAEYGHPGPVIGVAADGSGYGPDGTVWGGEVLVATCASYERVGHLGHLILPGGEQAVRQPWRVAAAALAQLYGPDFWRLALPFTQQLDQSAWQVLARMIERNLNSPRTSSLGRLFDAAAALTGMGQIARYEGELAIRFEQIADPQQPPYPMPLREPATAGGPFTLDGLALLAALVDDLRAGVAPAAIAGRVHHGVARALLAACRRVREERGLTIVALSGGVFQNVLLLETLAGALQADGFTVLIPRLAPPNDGGLALGQVAVAGAQVGERQ